MGNLLKRVALFFFILVFFISSSVVQVLAAVNYLYDANGNMTSDGTKCFEYDQENQLTKVKKCSNSQTIAEYVYDYQGNRLVKKEFTNGVLSKTVFSPNDEYETVKLPSGTTQNTTYYFANDELLAKKNPDGSKNYYHNDHLSSNAVLTNQSGALVEETKYDPWGEVMSGGQKSKFQYTGQEKDLETGLNYYNARYYDSHTRRFTQPDSLLENVYDPQLLNRYSYVRNNPTRYTDPTGQCISFLTPYCGMITSFLSRIVQPITNLVTKIASKPVTAQATQNVNKIQSNPASVKVEANAANAASKVGSVVKESSAVSKSINIGPHVEKQLVSRGWTQSLIEKTVKDPVRTISTKDTRYVTDGSKKLNEPATGYYAEDGSYVVLNDKTGDVVQISNKFKINWKAPWEK